MAQTVSEFGAGVELVTDWETGNLYIEVPVGGGETTDALLDALAEAGRQGLGTISPEEMGGEDVDDEFMRLWLVPLEPVEEMGWL